MIHHKQNTQEKTERRLASSRFTHLEEPRGRLNGGPEYTSSLILFIPCKQKGKKNGKAQFLKKANEAESEVRVRVREKEKRKTQKGIPKSNSTFQLVPQLRGCERADLRGGGRVMRL